MGWETLALLDPSERAPVIEDCGWNAYRRPWDRKMDAATSILAKIPKLMFIYAISISVETFMYSISMAKGWGGHFMC
jgi:hypothetical protein